MNGNEKSKSNVSKWNKKWRNKGKSFLSSVFFSYTPGEIEFRVSGFRKKLLDELKATSQGRKIPSVEPFQISQSQDGKLLPKGTHETAAVTILKNTVFKEALGIGGQFQDGNSVELAAQRKKDDGETKRLIDVQKELKTLDSSEEETSDTEDGGSKYTKKKKTKKRKHPPSESGEFVFSSDEIGNHTNKSTNKQHKSSKKPHSKKHKCSHSKEKKRHH
uniref:Uncharacterized protein n=1 Tax=Trichobilharzia regenti TaxID=157069 RepID=A0AA85ISM1_TRIRE|nr:unnamed protein product [Trichobilharzia regenti]